MDSHSGNQVEAGKNFAVVDLVHQFVKTTNVEIKFSTKKENFKFLCLFIYDLKFTYQGFC